MVLSREEWASEVRTQLQREKGICWVGNRASRGLKTSSQEGYSGVSGDNRCQLTSCPIPLFPAGALTHINTNSHSHPPPPLHAAQSQRQANLWLVLFIEGGTAQGCTLIDTHALKMRTRVLTILEAGKLPGKTWFIQPN